MTSIPSRAFFYWGNHRMPYLRYLSLYSFKKMNPNWSVILHTPKVITQSQSWTTFEQKYDISTAVDFWDEAVKLDIEICPVDFRDFGLSNDISEVHKSDFLRWDLLSKVGGLWSDMDIIYLKPIDQFIDSLADCTTVICWQKYFSIGFLLCAPGAPAFVWANHNCRRKFVPDQYESIGCWLFMSEFDSVDTFVNRFDRPTIRNIGNRVVYPFDSNSVPRIYSEETGYQFHPETIGLHWYAGHPIAGVFQKLITPQTFNRYQNVLCDAIRAIQ
jgi:hypothetical protein